MKAVIYQNYGGPEELKLVERPIPEPKANEVLIKIKATAINSADHRMLRASPFLVRLNNGLFRPKKQVLGADVAGIVERVGSGVTKFKAGDEVFASIFASGFGGLAEYVCAPESALCPKPQNISFEEAASLPTAGATALLALGKEPRAYEGKAVLVYGASGGVGLFAVQLAKHFGARVTAVCGSRNIEKVKSLGPQKIVDYTKETIEAIGTNFDLILAINGYNHIGVYKKMLAPEGRYLMVGGENKQIFEALLQGGFRAMGTKQKFGALTIDPTVKDLATLADLVSKRQLEVVIDRVFELDQFFEAFTYFEEGHAKGKVVMKIS